MTKTEAVREHLETNRGITTYEAFQKYGATRLADIIYRLRKYGHKIHTVEREQEDRFGNAVKFVEYRMEKSV